jgi:hypothetical protein
MEEQSCGRFDFGCHLGWVIDEIKELFIYFFSLILNGLASFLELIPVPDFLNNLTGSEFDLPPSITYFAVMLNMHYGIGIVVSAYVLRFILRRIPIIG